MSSIPPIRVRVIADHPPRADRSHVLYWMTANRRSSWNFALERSIELATQLGLPLLVFEALRCDYPWASDRLHRFVLDGMQENARALAKKPALYYPYVEPRPGAGRGLLEALAAGAGTVVTDNYPAFFLPRMLAAAGERLDKRRVRLEAVDSNGLFPLRGADHAFPTAHSFRRFLQKRLPESLGERPRPNPFARARLRPAPSLSASIRRRWPPASKALLAGEEHALARLPIDHDVVAGALRGGARAARARLRRFLRRGLDDYVERRNQPAVDATSGLSPYLHFGHISAHEIFWRLMNREEWEPATLPPVASGSRTGWWGVGSAAEAFLDQLVTWRELGFNMCAQRNDYDRYASLPQWARRTLEQHRLDARPHAYSRKRFEHAETHDPLWNAGQKQLVREGTLHNYIRMLWGKKILEWSRTPRQALATMIDLNNRYALDGRDPNSYSGIFWVLGRYDRAWGPERPIFGKIRYMSSENTARKFDVKPYLARYEA